MPKKLTGLTVAVDVADVDAQLLRVSADRLSVPEADILLVSKVKRSLDARRRRVAPVWVFTVDVWLRGEESALAEWKRHHQQCLNGGFPALMKSRRRTTRDGATPLIIGAGPAGLFAALTFSDHGVPALVLDRGKILDERHLDVRRFRRHGVLNPESNLCFGEGGAGAYSDGKLYTRKHHPLVRTVYERLVAFGATEDILVQAHPHVGTNRLFGVMEAARHHLIERGTRFRFDTRMTELWVDGGSVRGVRLADGEILAGRPVILAVGHSARDTYEALFRQGVTMVQKPFAVGFRCEHPQALIDEIQLGQARRYAAVEAAEYFLACTIGGRGVYSFCMCPGGYVIPTPAAIGHLNVNGMSNSNRGSKFANAALVVTVEPADFYIDKPGDLGGYGVLSGLKFQSEWEKRAFIAGGGNYCAPAQRLTDFVEKRSAQNLPAATSFKPGWTPHDLEGLLPPVVVEHLRKVIVELSRSMPGYYTREAALLGVETTTSSPVRMVRDENRQAPGFAGLYPAGEGAGYAGGIVSSAIDGIESAWAALDAWFD